MTIPQTLSAATRTAPVSLHVFPAQAVEKAQYGLSVRSPYHLPIRFKEPWYTMCPFAKGPRTPRLHEHLTKKEIPYRSTEEGEYRFVFRPHEPFFRHNRTRFAIGLIHMSIRVPWDSTAYLTKDGSGVRKIGRERNVNLETIENLRIIHDREAPANMNGALLQHDTKFWVFRRDILFHSAK